MNENSDYQTWSDHQQVQMDDEFYSAIQKQTTFANQTGRIHWTIGNEGFNIKKMVALASSMSSAAMKLSTGSFTYSYKSPFFPLMTFFVAFTPAFSNWMAT
jgi:hypothetical protein